MSSTAPDHEEVVISRQRSAIRRYVCSRPTALAFASGLLSAKRSVLDYGCGYGGDVRWLRSKKVPAVGWDPHFNPDPALLREADAVSLIYVLNVIESPTERDDTLRRAYELARRALIVAVRVDRDLEGAASYGDGVLTGAGTFQKLYGQAEFLSYLEDKLGARPHPASLGIAFVFKDGELEREYLETQALSGSAGLSTELIHDFEKDRTARRFVALANELGRTPVEAEFKSLPRLVERFGSSARLRRLLLRYVDGERFKEAARQRREDILMYLAVLRLRRINVPLGALSDDVAQDIRAFWTSYAAARAESEAFLFALGNPERVNAAVTASPVGKLLPNDLYIHRTAEDDLPALLRLLAFAAKQVVGEVNYDILKITRDGRAVSFLTYTAFDEDPHPALASSVRIYLPKSSYDIRDYREATNPPILHRKEAFVSPSYPRRALFEALTRAEDEAGLLSTSDIGYRRQWNDLLTAKGLDLRGHSLVVRSGTETLPDGGSVS